MRAAIDLTATTLIQHDDVLDPFLGNVTGVVAKENITHYHGPHTFRHGLEEFNGDGDHQHSINQVLPAWLLQGCAW